VIGSMLPRRYLFTFLALLTIACPAQAAPDEDVLGKAEGYPIGTPKTWFYDEHVRIGSFSHLDSILPHYTLQKSASPLPLPAEKTDSRFLYTLDLKTYSLDDFLARQRITGLLVIKDGKILAERYQYDRNASERFVSHSMAKSIVSIAIGMALAEKKIASLDDTIAKYVPKLAGTAYGETTIRNMLRMSSGVPFSEVYDGKDDLTRFSLARVRQDTIAALSEFRTREAEQGTRFHYASSETVNLVLVLQAVTGMPLSDYLTPRLWQPMGAEADATWVKLPDGTVSGAGSFNATLRDYGRLGVLLANDGMAGGKQVIPKDYLLDATDWRRQPEAFQPYKATRYFGYGYQFWLFPGEKRRFALLGVYGQTIFVDPELKLVLVLTAAAKNGNVGQETFGRERDAFWRGLVAEFGLW
jgi:CubicO group peptidase (beta-lactamase class C family)